MFMVDLAVPRDIEPEVKAWKTSTCTPWTTWPSVVQTGQANRQAAVAQAEAIIDAGVQSFLHWMDQRAAGAADPAAQCPGRRMARHRTGARAQAAGQGRDVDAVLEALSAG
jgi:glutamyl-tRNA reductase